MQLHYQARGHGDPVIVLHGLFGSLENWHSFNLRLSEHYRVYGLDQRNHGRSPHHPEMSYPLMADDVARLMMAQKITGARVVGHSMGGKTAMQLALDHPQAVRQLVVVDISPKAYPPYHAEILEGLQSLDLRTFQNRKQMEDALALRIPDLRVRQFLLKNVVRQEGKGFDWRMGLGEIASNYELLGAAIESPKVYDGPALFIRGENSDYLLPEDLLPIQKLFPKGHLQSVANAGHWVHVEAPEKLLQLVTSFFAGPS